MTKDGIRELLTKRIIDLVPTFKGLQSIRVIGRTEDGKVLSIDLGSEDGVTMGYSEQVWTLKDEDDPDLCSSRDMIRNIRFNIEPKKWKTDKKNVVKVNCFLVHAARDFAGWNAVWKEVFPSNPPARTTVGGDIAMEGALIEVELIATV